ncbi:YajG family lipoprotein [Geomesophilobacter sediminis]|uniref:Lipoprotein n=1 Tax=Geomesophilobacter sediminis TaxID=2798584 RepID=A0A8J7M234_9BACT|nr:hypothetical protein [Geomesophilobacter sediminis]MBJ6727257.1 hypothetical protein [Geomesophilobacter sediminis]
MTGIGNLWGRLLLLVTVIAVTGCASVDQHVTTTYAPASGVVGGSGVIYVTASGRPERPRDAHVEWVVGQVKNDSGEKTGEILSRLPPEELLMQALSAELSSAGYQVVSVNSLTPEMTKGVDVTRIVVNLDVIRTSFKATANSSLAYDVDLLKNGSRFKKLHYSFSLTDTAVSDKDRIADQVLQQSLQQLMKQSVPEIVRALEQAALEKKRNLAGAQP